ncbi:GDYXXLXY domain-containing protein [Flagellimonas flava]|uniref:Uncharacterized membrane-anchored protein n=1 Tax=Flagellimonas flava TaxID=570519 RepID=A0A1M5KYI5_9FLAO|nr:GDYXXLXY domain-containing protein [Allomuricauda flava]SHG57730.1 Uncharacterized membrane-anchored protein [Allomuricauda flava]
MNTLQKIVILVNLVVVVALFTRSVFQKEEILSGGKLVLLELAPVDPRSLIQGDYMRLSYAISREVDFDSISKNGFCILQLHQNGTVDSFRLQEGLDPLSESEYPIRYTKARWNSINIGAESYFFQEGQAEKYENAKYGGIKVDGKGNSLLFGLYDEHLNLIE